MPKRRETPRSISLITRLNRLARQLPLPRDSASQMVFQMYAQEGFIARLIQTPYQDRLVLGGSQRLYRGGLGLSEARPTQDADFLCRLENEPAQIETMVRTILDQPYDDELTFDWPVRIFPILQTAPEKGLRVRIESWLGVARITLWFDLAFGTPLFPGPEQLHLTLLLRPAETLPILGYPVETVMAGKVASLLEKGVNNSRAKDAFDLHFLAHRRDFVGDTVLAALRALCAQEGVALDPQAEAFASDAFLTDPQQLRFWNEFIEASHLAERAPTFAAAIEKVRALYGPVLRGEVQGKHWNHTTQRWQ